MTTTEIEQTETEQTEQTEPIGERPTAPVETRSVEYGVEILDVRFPDRTLEVLAVPYERETDRAAFEGRPIIEIFSRGSFAGIERRANRVKVNRDHRRELTIGRATALHPSRANGLVAELKISKTPLGDESLELAADGVLDPSVGFAPMADGQIWTNRHRHRRITRAWLDHIALVPDPAFDDARVLDVRRAEPTLILPNGTPAATLYVATSSSMTPPEPEPPEPVSATPNKDRMLALLAEIGYHPRST